ncbi:uncharacterized protein NECHADRAFT_82109 [Fusarium vanettenii 77-13-4]|uniref:Uncharacterized protein n=1 Tax=Fusarium vanettenii (strain ATCC MYA-4622 / CBS 123669 / FGSC 9596 / NRRL 45880 / 77-13-4) TaxID=660122 RepID=C7ZAI5_FUSV7|nr:uncharacterized protein NECHADRAFT_82109 [Fusarium vanettenii 77-13-4]EEU39280.1 predicted protein [Fusarium vanettenii 77-13-4]
MPHVALDGVQKSLRRSSIGRLWPVQGPILEISAALPNLRSPDGMVRDVAALVRAAPTACSLQPQTKAAIGTIASAAKEQRSKWKLCRSRRVVGFKLSGLLTNGGIPPPVFHGSREGGARPVPKIADMDQAPLVVVPGYLQEILPTGSAAA